MDLSSKSIGIALSGGGSKGIAQAGALKFLEEQNIKPSHIAGTSAGAIIAALYAYGKKPEEILDFFKSIYFFHWRHFTFKKAGIIDSLSFKSDFERIDSYISKLNIKDNLTVIMEATSIYHKAPERFFKENNYHVIGG